MTESARYGWVNGRGEPPGYLGLLGCEVTEWRDGRCVVHWVPAPVLANTAGFVQGGFIAAGLDLASALAAATSYEGDVNTATVRLDVEYFRPVKAGADNEYRLEGQLIRASRSWVSSDASLLDAKGNLMARARHLIAKNRPAEAKGR